MAPPTQPPRASVLALPLLLLLALAASASAAPSALAPTAPSRRYRHRALQELRELQRHHEQHVAPAALAPPLPHTSLLRTGAGTPHALASGRTVTTSYYVDPASEQATMGGRGGGRSAPVPRVCLEQRPLVTTLFMARRPDGRVLFGVVTFNARRRGSFCAMRVEARVIGMPPRTPYELGVYEYGDSRKPGKGSAGRVFRPDRKNAVRKKRVPASGFILDRFDEPRFDDYRKLAGRGFLIRSLDRNQSYVAVGVIGIANPTLAGTMGGPR